MDGLESRHWHNIVILTGAGVSAESGLGTFRGPDGLWENHRVEQVATPEAFARDPALVYRFYNERRGKLAGVEPNAAHRALVDLERGHRGSFVLITQNVDDLHERAGSKRLLHMHGELNKMRCQYSDEVFDALPTFAADDLCECCARPGGLRPHVVWFGEMPLYMEEIHTLLADCDLFVAIGTSGTVYPAAGFVQLARQVGATTLEINPDPTDASSLFEYHWRGPATEQVRRLADTLLKSD